LDKGDNVGDETREQVKRLVSARKNQEIALLISSNALWMWIVATQLPILMAAVGCTLLGCVFARKLNPGGLGDRAINNVKRKGAQVLFEAEKV
jgi:hypothetical protein